MLKVGVIKVWDGGYVRGMVDGGWVYFSGWK